VFRRDGLRKLFVWVIVLAMVFTLLAGVAALFSSP
jgi:succinate dehydrogenase hydrophobic anchor subunit